MINTICIIDDDDIYQFASKRIIQKFDSSIKVIAYRNGMEAMTAFTKFIQMNKALPDVILLDINMPIMDGWQFMEEYSKIKSGVGNDVHIYITSSSLDINDVKRAEASEGVKGFLSKPLSIETILKTAQGYTGTESISKDE